MVRGGLLTAATVAHRLFHRRAGRSSKPQPPPLPSSLLHPKPPQKLTPVSLHGETLHNPYAWMASLSDDVAMCHMDLHMDQDEKYCEAALASLDADKLVSKLQIELAPRLASDLRTPPLRCIWCNHFKQYLCCLGKIERRREWQERCLQMASKNSIISIFCDWSWKRGLEDLCRFRSKGGYL